MLVKADQQFILKFFALQVFEETPSTIKLF